MANMSPNTSKMVESKKMESRLKKQTVLAVLKELTLLDDPISNPISKAEICRKAGVSKTFLYSYPEELIKPIDEAIIKQNQKLKVITKKQTFSESSKDKLIDSLKRRIGNLEEENKKLKRDNSILLGKIANK
ncbi:MULTISPECIES: DUF6262 family protein [Bacillus]|jgi:hypothetical protein|uniref:Uncharacterized protein n=3 Tax=Bacillus cereus group TaxID=86661 RepID=A0A151V0T5_BACCE|nr:MULTISPECIES: DUF6262 family protein [Bacillus]MDV8116486.1 DUF6262 family protein [Bacillus sp. BAU-SS-2023]MPU17060.1 hypothetical protein [Acinetobacter baumannii]CJC70273.1 Uncharacterised protein [Streptococcus pneumoniae]HDR7487698.1 hypothetical protein [Bacillus pacificus]AQQ64231.1 hypothetical Protein FORC21_3436 [Bacillus cereus]